MTVAGPAYRYRAVVASVHDGDTITVDIDLGFRMWLRKQPVRLADMNAREISEPGGREARDHLRGLLPVGTVVTVTTAQDDKYGGRWNASVVLPDGQDLAGLLIADGWAAPWDGAGERALPPWPRPDAAIGGA